MKKRFFDYGRYITTLTETEDDAGKVKIYEEKYGPQKNAKLEDQPYYKDYLSKFDVTFDVAKPPELDISSHEWMLFLQFVFGAFSTSYHLCLDKAWKKNPVGDPIIHVIFVVSKGKREIIKLVEDFSPSQIFTLFEIYTREQLHLTVDIGDFSGMKPHEILFWGKEYYEWKEFMKKREMTLLKFTQRKEDLMRDIQFYRNLKGLSLV